MATYEYFPLSYDSVQDMVNEAIAGHGLLPAYGDYFDDFLCEVVHHGFSSKAVYGFNDNKIVINAKLKIRVFNDQSVDDTCEIVIELSDYYGGSGFVTVMAERLDLDNRDFEGIIESVSNTFDYNDLVEFFENTDAYGG
jgi:hypothetical protein